MRDDTKEMQEPICQVMSPAQFNRAVTPISPVQTCPNSFKAQLHSISLPCDDCLSVLSDPEEDSRPFTPSCLDLPTKYVVTFLSPISSPSKIPSNPASPDETPASPLRSSHNPSNVISDAAPSSETGLQFSFSLPKTDQSKITKEVPPNGSLLSDV